MYMADGDAGTSDAPSERLVEQRVRNRIMEYLELASSFEEQRKYERNAPIAHVPYEVINQWDDQVWIDPRQKPYNLDVYDAAEIEALARYQVVLAYVTALVPDNYPTLSEVQAMPEWDRLRLSAKEALDVLMRRGKLPEDSEG